jgi:hypothetical protein
MQYPHPLQRSARICTTPRVISISFSSRGTRQNVIIVPEKSKKTTPSSVYSTQEMGEEGLGYLRKTGRIATMSGSSF